MRSYWKTYLPRTWFVPSGFGTLGFALPSAIGAKVAIIFHVIAYGLIKFVFDVNLHFIHLYDGLIYVDIAPEVMWRRFKERFPGRSHSFKKMREVIHERAWQQSQILRRVITTQTAVPYLVLKGGDNVQENAQKVVSFVTQKIIAA